VGWVNHYGAARSAEDKRYLFLLIADLEKLINAVSDGSDDPDHTSEGLFILDYDCARRCPESRNARVRPWLCRIRGSGAGLAAGDSEIEALRQ